MARPRPTAPSSKSSSSRSPDHGAYRAGGDVIAAAGGTSQRGYSRSPSRRSRRHSTDPGEIWLAWSSAARRGRALLTRTHRSIRSGGWPAKSLPVSAEKAGRDGGGQRPGQYRQPGPVSGQCRGAGGGPVVGVPGHSGVVEDEQATGLGAGGSRCDMTGELGRRLGWAITASTLGQAGSIAAARPERESRGQHSLMTHFPCTHRGTCQRLSRDLRHLGIPLWVFARPGRGQIA